MGWQLVAHTRRKVGSMRYRVERRRELSLDSATRSRMATGFPYCRSGKTQLRAWQAVRLFDHTRYTRRLRHAGV